MKKIILSFITLSIILTGCGSKNIISSDSTSSLEPTISVSENEDETSDTDKIDKISDEDVYRDLLLYYKKYTSPDFDYNENYEECADAYRELNIPNLDGVYEENFVPHCGELFAGILASSYESDVYYTFEDIDSNNQNECIIYIQSDENSIVLGIYTFLDNQLISVVDGWARNRFYLGENPYIYNEGSSGAALSTAITYSYENGSLKRVETLDVNDYEAPDIGVFFHNMGEDVIFSSDTLISEEEYAKLFDILESHYRKLPSDNTIGNFQ